MRYKVVCIVCHESVWVRGDEDPTVNALELKDNDSAWDDACKHIKAGGDYEVTDSEPIDDDEFCCGFSE